MFAERIHEAFIELAENQEELYRLPPISEGVLKLEVRNSYATSGPKGETVFHTDPTDELELELRHAGHLKRPFRNFVLTESLWRDDLWRLRVRRPRHNPDPAAPPAPPRRYSVKATYNSLLPVLERKLPARFFHDGFEANWNQQQYLALRLNANRIELRIREDLRQLENLSEVTEIVTDPPDEDRGISFLNTVDMISMRLDIGAGRLPGVGENMPFISARLEFPAVRVKIRLPFHADEIEDLPNLTMNIRFFLRAFGKDLAYTPTVDSNLLDRLDRVVHFPGRTVNLKDELKPELEARIFNAQIQVGRSTFSRFGEFVAPWLVGSLEELYSVAYAPGPGDVLGPDGSVEPATGEVIVRYVGRRTPPSVGPVLTDDVLDGAPAPPPADDGAKRLFIVPDEEPDPVPAPPLPLRGGSLQPLAIGALARIDHIVVLMQENRSFDQVLGYLRREDINPAVDGLLPPDDPGTVRQFNRFANRNFFPQRVDRDDPPRASATGWPGFDIDDPCHNNECVLRQTIEMKGFVADFAERLGVTDLAHPSARHLRLVMDYFNADDLPVYGVLAREFAISDRWYPAHAGPTFPNRFVTMTGDLNRDPLGKVEENNPDVKRLVPIATPTLFDRLNQAGVSWRVFEHGYCFLRLFRNFTYDTQNIVPFDDQDRGFAVTARSGRLPSVSIIEPDLIDLPPGNDDHAPADMMDGQDLVRRIVEALVASPQWEKTLLIITYDEHGGFYDHRPPPTDAPVLLNRSGTMGPRVPAFFVSPWVPRGGVFFGHEDETGRRFDHTSIGATILRRFIKPRPPRVSPRLDAALDLREVLTLAEPRPKAEFTSLFASVPPPRRRRPGRQRSAPERARRIGRPRDNGDFHWLLSATRLLTGQPPAPRMPPGIIERPAELGALLHVTGVTTDGRLWHTVRFPSLEWESLTDVASQAGDRGAIVGVRLQNASGTVHLCALDAAGRLWHTLRGADGAWSTFSDVAAQATDRGPFTSIGLAELDGDLHVCGVTKNGRLWHAVRRTDGSWLPFDDIERHTGEAGTFTDVDCTSLAGELHVYAVVRRGRLRHTIRRADRSWTPFGELDAHAGSRGVLESVSCASVAGELHVCSVAGDGHLWHCVRRANGRWTPFTDVEDEAGDRGRFKRADIAGVEDELHLCGVTANGRFWHATRRTNGTWVPFVDVEDEAGERGKFRTASATGRLIGPDPTEGLAAPGSSARAVPTRA